MPSPAATRWGVISLAVLLPLLIAAFTGHAWEDYFITLRASLNLVEGHGLVFTPGERLHTFTSPLGVLLPALALKLGGGHEMVALWIYRVMNAAALGVAAWTVWRRFDEWQIGTWPRWIFFGLLLVDAKLTDFAMNGMETGLLVCFTLLLWNELEAPSPRSWGIAMTMAGLMWTRPDACILIGALCVPHLVIRGGNAPASRPWSAWLRGTLGGAVLYLPWFAWAWWYYGSPVPHTIIAKSQITTPPTWQSLLTIPWRSLLGDSIFVDLFLPTYWASGGWPRGLVVFAHVLTVLTAFAWLWPKLSAPARRLSLTLFLGMFYLCAIILFPWYSPPWAALAYLALAWCAHETHCWLEKSFRAGLPLFRIAACVALLVQIGIWLGSAWEMRMQQQLIENSVRKPIGLWLRENARPTDTVFLEPLGYVGFYSGLKMYDYPGLSSTEVVQQIRQGSRRFAEVITALKPTWLVLRPFELADPKLPENAGLRDYELVRTWSARESIESVRFLPGRSWLLYDAEFRVYRRRDASGRSVRE